MKKSERINQELIFLSHKKSFNLSDLMNEFNISKRTALRDIENLEALGLSFYVENGRYGGYRIINRNFSIPVYFDNAEITSILFAVKSLKMISDTPFDKSYDRIYQKLLATISTEQKNHILELLDAVDYVNFPPVNISNHLTIILEAILELKVMDIVYTQHGYVKKQILVYNIFYRNGVWFFNALDINKNTWSIYRCDYIEECAANSKIKIGYTRKELCNSLEKYEKSYHNIPFKCKLTPFGKELFLKNNYSNMKLEFIDNEIFLVGSFNKNELNYMVHYLIGMGNNVVIEYPQILKDGYLEQIERILNNYGYSKL